MIRKQIIYSSRILSGKVQPNIVLLAIYENAIERGF